MVKWWKLADAGAQPWSTGELQVTGASLIGPLVIGETDSVGDLSIGDICGITSSIGSEAPQIC
jgi:hypothetical protein